MTGPQTLTCLSMVSEANVTNWYINNMERKAEFRPCVGGANSGGASEGGGFNLPALPISMYREGNWRQDIDVVIGELV